MSAIRQSSVKPPAYRKSEIEFFQLQQLLDIAAFWAKDRSIEDLARAVKNSNPVLLFGTAKG